MVSKKKNHAVLVPFPVQGHINPMMHLAKMLASHGFFVTFINTHHTHSRMLKANTIFHQEGIQFAHIPDGLPQSDGRKDFAKLASATENTMPPLLRNLIYQINRSQDCPPVTCLIADFFAGWALDVAHHFDIPGAGFWPGLIATYAIIHHAPLLISQGIIQSNGIPQEHVMVKYLPCMPPFHSVKLPWLIGNKPDQEFRFQFWVRNMHRLSKLKWVLCNSFNELENPIINTFPEQVGICPIGPFLPVGNTQNNQSLWREEFECLDWLDKRSSKSVIYVSFGSIAVLNEEQVEELAVGLEATGQPFLWVVRPDLMNGKQAVFPSGFLERVTRNNQGFIASWAPQTSVLSHPSITCFITHCGWNSTVESITAGVPMLCCPYYADQFLNCAYISLVWKIGLALNPNQSGIIEAEEIKKSVWTIMMGQECIEIKKKVAQLKIIAMAAAKTGGSSHNNFNKFLNDMNVNT